MKITPDDPRDEVSIHGLKCIEYTILIGALRAASNDLRAEYVVFYGAERGDVVSFLNKFEEEDKRKR